MGPLHSAHPFALTHDPKPTVVLVPDAWFCATAYARFIAHFEQREYSVEIIDHLSLMPNAQDQASSQSRNIEHLSAAADATSLYRNLIYRLIEREGRDIVIVAHGYGAKPGLNAARGLHKATRFRQDLPGGVVGIIGISPMVLHENTRLEYEDGTIPPWATTNLHSQEYCLPISPFQRFAADCSPKNAGPYLAHMRPMAIAAFESLQPATVLAEPDYEGCLAAIVLTDDQTMPANVQDHLLSSSGAPWMVHRMHCSHSAPFVERCSETVDVAEQMIEAFERRLDERWVAESQEE